MFVRHQEFIRADGGAPARSEASLPAYPREMSVHAIFSWYARNTPDAPALLQADTVLTYAELAGRANQLARRLAQRGIGKDCVVGLLTHRSINALVAWLAVLKCGASYLPLDPAYPVPHLALIAEDSKPTLILADDQLITGNLQVPGFEVASLERELAASSQESPESYDTDVDPATTPAYLMYTSGSTGKPKGVVVPHRAIVRLVREQNYARFAADEVFLSLAPLAFDACTFEVWGALLNGARVGIVTSPSPSLDEIADAIARFEVSTLWLTAGLFHVFVDCQLEALKPVKQLLSGGDVLSPVHVKKALAALPECRLINGYGPTENTTFSCCHTIGRDDWHGPIPIGTPIAHTQAHIVDADMKPVVAGEAGQLCVGGDGVALGYLNRPDLNGHKFIADPFASEPAARLYPTGDLVRQRADGTIEFLGRTDRQVKIDGKRIELDEIELNLRRDARLADAIVVLRNLAPDVKRIAAFLKPATVPWTQDLRDAVLADLRARLPAHMIPHETVLTDAFPLTANGKVDRSRLLELHPYAIALVGAAATQAANSTEERLAQIWAHVLRQPQVDRNTNFSDLGATSLQVVRVFAEIKRQITRDIAITDLFAHPRITGLARFLDGRSEGAGSMATVQTRAARQLQAVRRAQRTARKTT